MSMNTFTENRSVWEVSAAEKPPKLAPAGDYTGRVLWTDEGEYPGGAKIGPCRCVTVTIQFRTPDGVREVTDRFYNWPSMLWRVSAFCRAVGLKRHGEPCKVSWPQMMGRQLKFHVTQRSYTGRDGERHLACSIDKYYPYDAACFPPEEVCFDAVSADEELPF